MVSVGGLIAILGLLLSVFAGGGGGGSSSTGTTQAPAAVSAPAQQSCASFDQATGRLAAKDNKGFIDDMTAAASSAQTAAGQDNQWQTLLGQFAAFANDLSANDPTKVSADLSAINQLCTAVRGPRDLNLTGP